MVGNSYVINDGTFVRKSRDSDHSTPQAYALFWKATCWIAAMQRELFYDVIVIHFPELAII